MNTVKIALYGAPGSRKTLQIRSLIEAYGADNVGVISAEQGLNTIQSVVTADNVREVTTLDELRQAYGWARGRYTKPEQWVVVDGGSRVFNWVSQEVWQNVDRAYEAILEGTARKALPDALKPYARFITGKDEIDGMRCWVSVGSNANWLMDAFVKLPSSLMMTFWSEQPNIDQYTKGAQHSLDLPGKGARDAVIGAFDFIFRLMSVDADHSKAICRTTNTSFAKARDDRTVYTVPPEIERFNLAEFVKNIRGEKNDA